MPKKIVPQMLNSKRFQFASYEQMLQSVESKEAESVKPDEKPTPRTIQRRKFGDYNREEESTPMMVLPLPRERGGLQQNLGKFSSISQQKPQLTAFKAFTAESSRLGEDSQFSSVAGFNQITFKSNIS